MNHLDAAPPSGRTRLHRNSNRARYHNETVAAILDEGLICTVAFVSAGSPVALPTAYGRDEDLLFLHGSSGGRMMRSLGDGRPLSVNVTLTDGIVVARSAFNSSFNYRSVVVFGSGRPVEDTDERLHALRTITDHIVPGRWDELRAPTRRELAATAVVAMELGEASAKVRSGPPHDDEDDYRRGAWGGVVPLSLRVGAPLADGREPPGVVAPASVVDYRRPRRVAEGRQPPER